MGQCPLCPLVSPQLRRTSSAPSLLSPYPSPSSPIQNVPEEIFVCAPFAFSSAEKLRAWRDAEGNCIEFLGGCELPEGFHILATPKQLYELRRLDFVNIAGSPKEMGAPTYAELHHQK